MKQVELAEQPYCDICKHILGDKYRVCWNKAKYDGRVKLDGFDGGAYICEEHKDSQVVFEIYCEVIVQDMNKIDGKDQFSIVDPDGGKILLFGETGRITQAFNVDEYHEYHERVHYIAYRSYGGHRNFARETGEKTEAISFDDLPEITQSIIRGCWG